MNKFTPVECDLVNGTLFKSANYATSHRRAGISRFGTFIRANFAQVVFPFIDDHRTSNDRTTADQCQHFVY